MRDWQTRKKLPSQTSESQIPQYAVNVNVHLFTVTDKTSVPQVNNTLKNQKNIKFYFNKIWNFWTHEIHPSTWVNKYRDEADMHDSTTAVDQRRVIPTRRNYSRNTESRVKVQAVQEESLTVEDGTNRVSSNISK